MGIASSWSAVIDSLSAGYRFLGRRVGLILIPVLLDLWLWFGPRLSVAPLVESFVRYYENMAGMQEIPTMPAEMSPQALVDFSQTSNLMDSLVSGSLLHVPSLLASIGPVSASRVVELTNPVMAVAIFFVLSILGLFIGVLYMNLLAWQLPLGEGAKPTTAGELLKLVVRQWLMVVLFIIAMTALIFAGMVPIVFGSVLLSLIAPALSSVLVTLYIGVILVAMFYLYFVTTAIVLDDLPLHHAIMQSVVVVRNNFLATLLFILLTMLISVGVTLIMRQLTQLASVGVAVAIPINAYIGSGIVLALFVFYRTRVLRFATVKEEVVESARIDKSE